jgi:hypothetical protein
VRCLLSRFAGTAARTSRDPLGWRSASCATWHRLRPHPDIRAAAVLPWRPRPEASRSPAPRRFSRTRRVPCRSHTHPSWVFAADRGNASAQIASRFRRAPSFPALAPPAKIIRPVRHSTFLPPFNSQKSWLGILPVPLGSADQPLLVQPYASRFSAPPNSSRIRWFGIPTTPLWGRFDDYGFGASDFATPCLSRAQALPPGPYCMNLA